MLPLRRITVRRSAKRHHASEKDMICYLYLLLEKALERARRRLTR
jgi:hypothetical protein